MVNNHTYSAKGLANTKSFERLSLSAYPDIKGVVTIGWGHTGPGIVMGMRVTEAEAEILLQADLAAAIHCVNAGCTVPLTQGQFDAMVDFAFNAGLHAFMTSTLRKLVNQGNYAAAALEFPRWDHCDGVEVAGLRRRRLLEQSTFDMQAAIDYDFDAEYERWADEQDERYRADMYRFLSADDDSLERYIKALEESGE